MAHVLADELKEAVLKAAFTGKLSANEKCDSNASTTLQEIVELQKKLVNNNQIKVGKFNKEIVNDTGEEFPEHWTLTKVGFISSLVTKQTGFDYSKKIKPNLVDKKSEKTYPLIQTRNFKGKYFDFNSKYYIPIKVAEDFPNLILNKSCLLLSIVGASIGNVGYYNENKVGFLGGAIAKIDLLKNEMMDYIYYYLISPLGVSQIMKNYKSTAQGTITVEDVRNILIPFPPIEEQQRIVNRVNELMAKIDEYEKLENQLVQLKEQFPKDMRDSLLQAAMHGQLSEQYGLDTSVDTSLINHKFNKNMDDTEFDVPDTWSVSTLEGVAIPVASKKYQIKESEVQKEGTCRVISQSQQMILGYTNKKEKLFHHNRPVITFGDHTTVVKFINFDFVVGADGLKIFEPTNIVDSKYMYYALTYLSTNLEKVGGYSRHYKFIKNKPIGIPPLEEQQRIVDKLDEMLPLVDSLAQMD